MTYVSQGNGTLIQIQISIARVPFKVIVDQGKGKAQWLSSEGVVKIVHVRMFLPQYIQIFFGSAIIKYSLLKTK